MADRHCRGRLDLFPSTKADKLIMFNTLGEPLSFTHDCTYCTLQDSHLAQSSGYVLQGQTAVTYSYCCLSLSCRILLCHRVLAYLLTAVQRQTAVTPYLKSKLLLLFVFDLQDSLLSSSTGILTAAQRQTAVTAHFSSEQLLLFAFELQDSLLSPSTGILTAVQRQTAVTAYFSIGQQK